MIKKFSTKFIAYGLVFEFIVSLFFVPSQAFAVQLAPKNNDNNKTAYVENEVIVKFKPSVSSMSKESAKKVTGLKTKRKFHQNDVELTKITDGKTVNETIDELTKNPNVLFAQPNYIYYTSAAVSDPDFSKLWGSHNDGTNDPLNPFILPDKDINAPEAWDLTMGSPTTVVAVIDTGIDINHPDLAANIWTNPGETPNDGIDNDGNSYVDDVNGWDFYWGDNTVFDPEDGEQHGTHVAGTIAAVTDSTGIAGVAPQVKIMPLKFLGPDGAGTTADAISAIEYADTNGAKIANLSWGSQGDDPALLNAINNADMVFIAAAGNDGLDIDIPANMVSPAGLASPKIISVAAVTSGGSRAGFSNFGAAGVDVGAPGENIWSLIPVYQGLGSAVQSSGTVSGHTYKVVHLGFGLETIGDDSDRTNVMQQILTHLDTSTSTPIMLVDDDNSEADPVNFSDFQWDFQTALSGYNVTSVVYAGDNADGPGSAAMNGKTVIWFTGNASGTGLINTLTDNDLVNLKTFLNNGGRLLLVGGCLAAANEQDQLFTTYLKEKITMVPDFFTDIIGTGQYTGTFGFNDFMAPGWRYVLTPTGSSEIIFRYNNTSSLTAYTYKNGTSQAAPHVSGAAALMLSINPTLTPAQIIDLLKQTGRPLASLNAITVSGKMINAHTATLAAKIPNTPTDLTANPGNQLASLTWNGVTDADLAGYNIYRDNIKINDGPVAGTVYQDVYVANDTLYSYKISAVDNYGFESPLTTAQTVTPYSAQLYPTLAVIGSVAARNGSTLQFGGTTTAGATKVSAVLEQLDSGGSPIGGANIDVTAAVTINGAGNIGGNSGAIGAFNVSASSVRLKLTVDVLGIQYIGTSLPITIDNTPPSVSLTYNKTSPISTGLLVITATFSEDISGTPTISIDQSGATDIVGASMAPSSNPRIWTYSYSANLPDGMFYLDGPAAVSISSQDKAGNANDPATGNSFVIDTAPSAAPVIYRVDGKSTPATANVSSPQVVVNNVSAGDTIKIYDGSSLRATQAAAGISVTVTVTGLSAEGLHLLTAKAVDPAGNISAASDVFSYSLDLTPPSAPVISTVDGQTSPASSSNASPQVVVSNVSSGDTVAILSGSTSLASATSTGSTVTISLSGLSTILYQLKARATDPVGNTSSDSPLFSYTVTGSAPPAPGGGGGGGSAASAGQSVEKTIRTGEKASVVLSDVATVDIDGDEFIKDYTLVLKEVASSTSANTAGLRPKSKIVDISEKQGLQPVKAVLLTFKYTPDVGDTRKLGVYYFNEKSQTWEYQGGSINPVLGTITLPLNHFSQYAVMESVKTFTDIAFHWARNDIEVLAARSVVTGMDTNHFNPDGKITRAQFAAMIVKALKLKPAVKNPAFSDIKTGSWYTDVIGTAAEAGIIKGYSNGTFKPDALVTREEAAAMVVQALRYAGLNTVMESGEVTATLSQFKDVSQNAGWSGTAIAAAAKNGIIKGNHNGFFLPSGNTTRAETSAMIIQLITKLNLF